MKLLIVISLALTLGMLTAVKHIQEVQAELATMKAQVDQLAEDKKVAEAMSKFYIGEARAYYHETKNLKRKLTFCST